MALEGIQIAKPAWEVSGDYSLDAVLRALVHLAPAGATLYVEGGNLSAPVVEFLTAHAVQATTKVYPGTIAPKPLRFHIPATPDVLSRLADFAEPPSVCEGEICDHLILYSGTRVILSGYDFGSLALLLDREVPEEVARTFASQSGGVLAAAV